MDTNKLKQKIELLERENHALKKSLYELSTRYNAIPNPKPFAIGELLNSLDQVSSLFDKSDNEDNTRFVPREKSKSFYQKYELKGHIGAVYAVRFSPCGKYISSGSFDRTVRIWDASGSSKELHCLNGHGLNISDLSWSRCSSELLSGAYDLTCRTWDVEQGKSIESFESDGFVQCVQFHPQDKNIFFSGTSRNILCITDRRQPSAAISLKNDSMVNTISVFQDGTHVLTGDAGGNIKTWDVRAAKCIQTYQNEPTKKPISHIACCHTGIEEEPRYIAVNSYDNVMRVYDRGLSLPVSSYNLLHALKGYKNKNWPIRSSFFKRDVSSFGGRGSSTEDIIGKADLPVESRDPLLFDKEKPIDITSLLATGSADPYVYVYSIGDSEGTSELIQKLEGHTDRVYDCHFHPHEPTLVTGSADFSVRIWSLSSRKRNK